MRRISAVLPRMLASRIAPRDGGTMQRNGRERETAATEEAGADSMAQPGPATGGNLPSHSRQPEARMRRTLVLTAGFVLLLVPVRAQRRAITVEDLWSVGRIEEFALSPDGEWIAYTLTYHNIEDGGKNSDIYLINGVGGSVRQLTTHPGYDGRPCWSPDGSLLAFLSDRNGDRQIHAIPVDGGEAQQISRIPSGIDDFTWSPDGRYFGFTSTLVPRTSPEDPGSESGAARETQARLFHRLLYRHWNAWRNGGRSHVFVMPATGGEPWDVTPGDFDTPPVSLGSGRDFVFSPDGEEIAFVRNTDPLVAVSTNNDIFVVPAKGGTIRRITDNPANDNQPVFSPDGKYIAYRAMARPGFEADQYDLMLYERRSGRAQNLTEEFDLDIGEIAWGPTSNRIYFTCDDHGGVAIFSVELRNGRIKGLVLSGCNSNIRISPNQHRVYFLRTHINLPNELFSSDEKGEDILQLTFVNQRLLSNLEITSVENLWYQSFDNKIVHGYLLKPPFFDPAKVYSVLLLIHGGPQGAWKDQFHYRWNAPLFASRGHVVLMLNIRGSKGYGQDFCDAVTKNWGDGPFRDIMLGLDHALKKYPYLDPQRIAAAGGSYGGYLVNWIAGHTDRFRCLISHAGISNPLSFYGATEELWFPEWEFGALPYETPRSYDKWSPLRHAKNFKTPTLVIHGQQDFRVPVEQGMQMFTALQRYGVPSKFLYFPDEGHFITKPRNARLWWNTIFDWLEEWTR